MTNEPKPLTDAFLEAADIEAQTPITIGAHGAQPPAVPCGDEAEMLECMQLILRCVNYSRSHGETEVPVVFYVQQRDALKWLIQSRQAALDRVAKLERESKILHAQMDIISTELDEAVTFRDQCVGEQQERIEQLQSQVISLTAERDALKERVLKDQWEENVHLAERALQLESERDALAAEVLDLRAKLWALRNKHDAELASLKASAADVEPVEFCPYCKSRIQQCQCKKS